MRKLLMGAIAMWFAWRYSRFVDPRILLGGIAATSVLLSLATIRQAYSVGWFGAIQHTHMRRTATNLGWGDANYIAALLTMLLPTVINQALTAHSKALRWLGIAGVLLTAIVVTIASSRGGSLLTLAIALFMIFRSRIKSWVVWVSAPAAIALILLGPGAQMLLARFHNAEDLESVVIRLWFWRVAWHRLLTFWPWGMGLGQGFRYLDRLYEEDPHDVWLMLGSELGLVGLVLWISVLVLVYRRILKIAHDPDTRVEGQALQLTFWITQFNALFEPTIFGVQYFFLLNWIWASYFGWADRVWEQRDAARAAATRENDPAPGSSVALSEP
jgi:cell division protein FtsW (lipid II flippase)